MVLSPLAVILLAQLGLVLLVVVIFQRLQKQRLLKELAGLKHERQPLLTDALGADLVGGFDRDQASLLLSRLQKSSQAVTAEAPAAAGLANEQHKLLIALGTCLNIQLQASAPAVKTDELVTQVEIDTALGKEEALEEFDLMDLDSLETSADAEGLNFDVLEEEGLPEDTLQAAIDRMGDFDLSDLEEELEKVDT